MRKDFDKPGTYQAGVKSFLKLIENANVQTPVAFSAPTVPGATPSTHTPEARSGFCP